MKKVISIFILTVLLFSTGCTSADQVTKKDKFIEDFYSMMDSSLGIMTYDDAVTRWGVPLRKTETEESFTAVWVSEVPDKLLGYKEEANSSVIKRVKIVEDVPRGEELTLGFNKDTMKLKNWNYEGW